jgi:hypothetical protein
MQTGGDDTLPGLATPEEAAAFLSAGPAAVAVPSAAAPPPTGDDGDLFAMAD